MIEARYYARTKAAYDQQQNPDREPPMLTLVKEIESELAAEAIEAMNRAALHD